MKRKLFPKIGVPETIPKWSGSDAARALEAAGIESKQAEAIVQTIRSSGEAAATRVDLTPQPAGLTAS